MQRVLWVLLLVGCKDKRPEEKPPATNPHVASHKRATVGNGSSQFHTDRAGACQAFADRLQAPITGDLVTDVANKCAEGKDVNAANYDCLMAATTLPAIEACLKTTGAAIDKAKCDGYAKHVVELMTGELRATSLRMCMSARMTEQAFDCVIAAQSDADFKKCLGANPM
jgi:hypothetical protein